MVYKVGTRTSPLAMKQVDEIINHLKHYYPDIKTEIIGIDTYGDKDRVTPISDIEGTDFFTREIDNALLREEIDFAVHSAKDLPDKIAEGLVVAAITRSIDSDDALVSKHNLKIDELRKGARIGASSQRRKTQLTAYRNDFQIVDIRGNIHERLDRLEKDNLDAIVVAACALTRLNLGHRISQRLPHYLLKPHPLQGSLAIVAKEDRRELIEFLRVIDGK